MDKSLEELAKKKMEIEKLKVGGGKILNLGEPVVEIEGCKFRINELNNNPMFMLLLLTLLNLNEKQEKFLDNIGFNLNDINGKSFYPKKEEEKEE